MIHTLAHCLRLLRAGFVFVREGVFAQIDPLLLPAPARLFHRIGLLFVKKRRPEGDHALRSPLAIALERLGPSYVKLGQFLTTRPDIVGEDIARQLEALQDKMTPVPLEEAIKIVEAAFKAPISSLFTQFSPAIAAASIAQVHKAQIKDKDGVRDVAVKLLRPHIEHRFQRDLSDMLFAAQWAEYLFPEAKRLRCVEVVSSLARHVRIEMDFRLEAAAASEFYENVEQDPHFHVPTIEWQYTAKEVLTLSFIEGIALTDIEALRTHNVNLPILGRDIIQSFLRHALRDGLFHADMHQGNLFVDHQGRLCAVDFGIMGRLGMKERRFLAEILYGFITRNYMRIAQVHFEAGYVPAHHRMEDFAQALRAIGEPIHALPAHEISMARLLRLLFEITSLFDMQTRTELVLLQKTMVVVEGVARKLDPNLNMWVTAEPIVKQWIEENLGLRAHLHDLGESLTKFASLITHMPDVMTQTEQVLQQASQSMTLWQQEHGEPAHKRNFWSTPLLPPWLIAVGLVVIWWVWRM